MKTKTKTKLKQLNNWVEKEWDKIIKTIVGAPCLVFSIASGFPLVTNGGLLRLIGFFNYFSGSIFLYFILYKYFKMEEELKQQLTEEGKE